MQVLVVEDEAKIREVLVAYLENEGWHVHATANGYDAVQLYDQHKHDLILLDLKLDGLPGEEVCLKIREKSNVPIIMLTSKSRESDTINGLHLGADDYVVKPFRAKELIARIHALMRRAVPQQSKKHHVLSFHKHHLVLDLDMPTQVLVDGVEVKLTSTEHKLLSVMATQPRKIFSRRDLCYEVMGYRFQGDGRVIDTHIKNVRKKIERDSKNPEYILTIIGSGYQFGAQPDAPQR
jgi:DNA-binding response OmpR family regulator